MLRFDYIEPHTLGEAVSLLSTSDGRGKIIAGGTDILVQIREEKVAIDRLVSLARIPGLRFIHADSREIGIGALTTIGDLERSNFVRQSLPVLSEAVEQFGSVQIRNMATIARIRTMKDKTSGIG